MIPKQELSQEQTEEIRALQGQLPAAETKKRFGIGSMRLYKIWRDESPQQPTNPPPPESRSAQSLLPYGGVATQQQQAPRSTVEDFYERLEGLESNAEHSTRLQEEVLAQLDRNDSHDAFLDKLEDALSDLAPQHREQTEAGMDLQKAGQLAETAKNGRTSPSLRCSSGKSLALPGTPLSPFRRNYGLPCLVVPPAGRRIVRRAPFLVSSSVVRCLYPLPNTVFSSATSALLLEFLQFCCSSECPVETVVVFALDVPHRFVGQKLFRELPALLLCSTGLWMVPFLRNIGVLVLLCSTGLWFLSFLRNIGLLALLCSTSLWMLPFLRNNGFLALLCFTGLWLLSFLRNNGLLALLCSNSLWMLPFLRNNGLYSLLLCTAGLEGPYLQKHSLQSLLVYTLCHGFWNHIGKLLQAPICGFFYIRVETVRSLLPKAVRRLQSRSGPMCALAYLRCLVRIRRLGSSGTGAYRVRGAVEGSSVDGRRCGMSLPFSASPPRPCIFRGIERCLGGPGIEHASPRESRHRCPAPFSERRWWEARQKGEFPPFVRSFCIVRGRFHRSSLPLEIPACPNISSKASDGILLLAGMVSLLDRYVSCGCSHCSYCLIGCFHLLPRAVATLLLSQNEHAALAPAFARASPGVPEERQNCPRTLGKLLLEWSPCWCKLVELVDAPPVSIALPCTTTCTFETAVALRQNRRNRQVERRVFLLGRCRLACCSRKRRGIRRHKEAGRRAILMFTEA